MLDQIGRTANLAGLFYKGVDWRNRDDLHACEHAFKNLTLHYVELAWPEVLDLVKFDDVKVQIMLQRFYRDAFGVWHFNNKLNELCPDKEVRKQIWSQLDRLSIRINSTKPRLTRVTAAFSLWMATFRPIYLKEKPKQKIKGIWHLDAAVNFYITTSFLKFYGNIRIGVPGHDHTTRLKRVYYDFTCRDLNLSSLEMLYCSIFEPHPAIAKKEAEADEFNPAEEEFLDSILGS